MGLDLTTALGRLLTDAELRSQFFSNRAATVKRLEVDPAVAVVLQRLNEQAFECQARGLIDKRFHEVVNMIPMTIRHLGENARTWFSQYAESFWPGTHRRHLIDAIEFCRYVHGLRPGVCCRSERNRLEFRLARRRFAIHFVSDYYVAGKRRLAIQVLAQTNDGIPTENVFYLRFPALDPPGALHTKIVSPCRSKRTAWPNVSDENKFDRPSPARAAGGQDWQKAR